MRRDLTVRGNQVTSTLGTFLRSLMHRFVLLYDELDRARGGDEKIAALVRYFGAAPPADAAWTLFLLEGRARLPRLKSALLRQWAAEEAQIPVWLMDECYDAVGDLSETIALLVPEPAVIRDFTLLDLIEQRISPLRKLHPEKQRELVKQTWRELGGQERFLFQKMISGRFRFNVARALVARALSHLANVPLTVMSNRLCADWQPTGGSLRKILSPNCIDEATASDNGKPYPFHSCYPLTSPLEELGPIGDWQIEWKWDGIRVQLVHRRNDIFIWSRDEEALTQHCPEIVRAADVALPEGTVMDGVLIAWSKECALPISVLQRRLRCQRVTERIIREAPIVFVVYDLLEWQGMDQRPLPLSERRQKLEQWHQELKSERLRLSPMLNAASWNELRLAYESCRTKQMNGIMLKRRASQYGTGRLRGDWWKWKREPYHIDAVLMYVQWTTWHRVSAREASQTRETTGPNLRGTQAYTFGVWRGDELVPVAKDCIDLSEVEMIELNSFIRENATGRFGSVRVVRPEQVFELAFEEVQVSARHKAGVTLRCPRIVSWRKNKPAREADSLETVRGLVTPALALSGGRPQN